MTALGKNQRSLRPATEGDCEASRSIPYQDVGRGNISQTDWPKMKFEITTNVLSGQHDVYAFDSGVMHRIAVVPRTKWKAFEKMLGAFDAICHQHTDWTIRERIIQSLIDAAPAMPDGHISSQFFDALKDWRTGTEIGDLLRRASFGDLDAIAAFPDVVSRREMIRTFGSHIVRITTVAGEQLGSGILVILPTGLSAPRVYSWLDWLGHPGQFQSPEGWGIITCSHVWANLITHKDVQFYCASTAGGIIVYQKMIAVNVDELYVLDMARRDFMEEAGVDPMLFNRDAAIISGNLRGLLPEGARALDLRTIAKLEPKQETYALVGYPLATLGELDSQFLTYEAPGRDYDRFSRNGENEDNYSISGASGGLVVAVRNGKYRPTGVVLQEAGWVDGRSVDSIERAKSPSTVFALPLAELRTMVERAGSLTFRNRQGTAVYVVK